MNKLISKNEQLDTKEFEIKFNQWLAGLIDGDGYFGIIAKKHPNCEITVGLEDEKMLRQIQNKFGGSVKLRAGARAVRYRLGSGEGIVKLIQAVNGEIRNTKRIVQFHKACSLLGIQALPPNPLTFSNAWISGFFDSDGTINYYFREPYNRPQLYISISNKYSVDVQGVQQVLGGAIYFDKAQQGCFKWTITNQEDHLRYYQYNKLCPSRSFKGQRIFLIKEYYELYAQKAYLLPAFFLKKKSSTGGQCTASLRYKAWVKFQDRWNR